MTNAQTDGVLLSRIIDGEITDEELQSVIDTEEINAGELRQLLECDELIRQTANQDAAVFAESVQQRIDYEEDGPAFTAGLMLRIKRRQRLVTAGFAIAAVLLVSVAYQLFNQSPAPTHAGYSHSHAFADGSHIHFNDAAQVQWQEDAEKINVNLKSGELQAVIEKERQRPYVFSTAEGSVLVRGTAFRLYQEHAQSVINLTEGSVDVESASETLTIHAPSRVRFQRFAAPQAIPLRKQNLFIITDFMSYDDYLAVIAILRDPSFTLCGIIATAGSVPYNQDVDVVHTEIKQTLEAIGYPDIPVHRGATGINLDATVDVPAVDVLHAFAQANEGRIAIANLGSYQAVSAALIKQYPDTAQRCVLANLARQRKGGWVSARDDGEEAFNYVCNNFPGQLYLLDEQLARQWTSIRLADLDALQSSIGKRIRERVTYTTKTMPIWDQAMFAVLSQACLEANTDQSELVIVKELPAGDPEQRGLRTLKFVP